MSTYRTVKILNRYKDASVDIPICIPSYDRPDAAILKFVQTERLPFILFIRKEQKALYKDWVGKCKIILLNNVHNIGQTRAAILQYCHRQGYSDIFMFDDKVNAVNFMEPHTTKTGNLTMCKSKQCMSMRDALIVWQYYIRKYHPAISGCQHKGYSWDKKYINQPPLRNGMETKIAIHICIDQLFEHNITYRDTETVGSEDTTLLFESMSAGLNVLTFTDLEYDNVPSGGSNKSVGVSTKEAENRKARFDRYNQLFFQNVLGGEQHPGVSLRQDRKLGVTYLRLIWKYWKTVGEDADEGFG